MLINSSNSSPYDDNGPLMTRVTIAVMVLPFIATILRFYTRKLVGQPWLWDDWLIPIALVPTWVCSISHIVAAEKGGLGRHIEMNSSKTLAIFFKCLYTVQITYPIAISCIKISILLFYRRIFNVRPVKISLLIIGASVLIWMSITFFMAIFSCAPVDGFWERQKSSTCIADITYFLGAAVPNVTTDVIIIIFPMPILWRLIMSTTHRNALVVIFFIGGFVVIISCLRLVAILQVSGSSDVTWALLPLGIFNVIEMNMGIFCACLPSMSPLLRILGKSASTTTIAEATNWPTIPSARKYWPGQHRNPTGLSTLESNNESLAWLNENPQNKLNDPIKTYIHGGGPVEVEMVKLKDQRVDRILVENTIHVESSRVGSP